MGLDDPSRLEVFVHVLAQHYLMSPLYRRYVRSLPLRGDERVLDFGAGSGALTRHLARSLDRGGHVVWLDVAEPWRDAARRKLSALNNVEYVLGDVREADLPDASCDAAVVHYVLHDLPPEERQPVVNALAAKLKPDGRLFLQEPTKDSHGMPASEIRRLMVAAGLRERSLTESKPFLLTPFCEAVFAKSPRD